MNLLTWGAMMLAIDKLATAAEVPTACSAAPYNVEDR